MVDRVAAPWEVSEAPVCKWRNLCRMQGKVYTRATAVVFITPLMFIAKINARGKRGGTAGPSWPHMPSTWLYKLRQYFAKIP